MTSMSLAFRLCLGSGLGEVERGLEDLVLDAESLGGSLAVCLGSGTVQKRALLAVGRECLVAGERYLPALLDRRGLQAIRGRHLCLGRCRLGWGGRLLGGSRSVSTRVAALGWRAWPTGGLGRGGRLWCWGGGHQILLLVATSTTERPTLRLPA